MNIAIPHRSRLRDVPEGNRAKRDRIASQHYRNCKAANKSIFFHKTACNVFVASLFG
ncbi:MAG: hypothetical protein HC903_29010 [Methylacidiphilales bacterium]|nr:hypothetical protein [Candidatus Methylacidiphilales bacterium]NJR19788.1 hypothetical protein [Calothrix sp. CSU_2_0]